MRRLHLWIGLVGLVAFILTGQYMDRRLGHLTGMADLPRMLYRSAHIYLLLGSLLNLLLGLYVTDAPAGWRRWEPHLAGSIRPYAPPALEGVLFGAVLHAISHVGFTGTPKGAPYGTEA